MDYGTKKLTPQDIQEREELIEDTSSELVLVLSEMDQIRRATESLLKRVDELDRVKLSSAFATQASVRQTFQIKTIRMSLASMHVSLKKIGLMIPKIKVAKSHLMNQASNPRLG